MADVTSDYNARGNEADLRRALQGISARANPPKDADRTVECLLREVAMGLEKLTEQVSDVNRALGCHYGPAADGAAEPEPSGIVDALRSKAHYLNQQVKHLNQMVERTQRAVSELGGGPR